MGEALVDEGIISGLLEASKGIHIPVSYIILFIFGAMAVGRWVLPIFLDRGKKNGLSYQDQISLLHRRIDKQDEEVRTEMRDFRSEMRENNKIVNDMSSKISFLYGIFNQKDKPKTLRR